MSSKKTILLLLIFAGQASLLLARDVKEDLKKISDAYVHQNFSMKVIYRLFPEPESTTSVEEKAGIIRKKNDLFYASYFGLEIIKNDRATCVVNHNLKTISIEAAKKENTSLVPDLDKSIKLSSSVQYDSIDGENSVYTFHYQNYLYNKIEMEFNRKTFLIKRITYYYQKTSKVVGATKPGKPRMDILFSDIDLQPYFASADFSTGKFFKKTGHKKYILRPAYKNYKLEIGRIN